MRKIISLVLFSVFLTYYASVTLFSHTHIINGVTIVHSHLYKGANGTSNHQHSEKNVSVIQLLSNFCSPLVTSLLSFGIILLLLHKLIIDPDVEDPLIPSVHGIYSLRAPPVSSLSFY